VEQQVRSYLYGVVGFAFVITWATLGATTAILAALACVAGLNANRLASIGRPSHDVRPRPAIRARPLPDEDNERLPLVPDDPSLILTVE
jgi:hypothetical protein